jgi:hypothetical protein
MLTGDGSGKHRMETTVSVPWNIEGIFFGTINGVVVNGMRWRVRLLEHGSEWEIGPADSGETDTTIRYCGDDVRDRTERTITQMLAAAQNLPSDGFDLVLGTYPTTQLTLMPGGRRSDPHAPVDQLGAPPDRSDSEATG